MDPPININVLISLIKDTYDRRKRSKAEKELEMQMEKPGVVPALLQLVTSSKQHISIRQAAASQLAKWISSSDSSATASEETVQICDADLDNLKDSIVNAIVHAPDSVQPHLLTVFRGVCIQEFRHNWPELCPQISDLLQSPEDNLVVGGLIILTTMVMSYSQFGPIEQYALEEELIDLFPSLQTIIELRNPPTPSAPVDALAVPHLLLKLMYGLVNIMPVSVFGSEGDKWENFGFIIPYMESILELSVEQTAVKETPTLDWMIVNKMALYTLNMVVNMTMCEKVEHNPAKKEFSMFFLQNRFNNCIQLVVKLCLENYFNRSFSLDAEHALRHALMLLTVATKHASTWKHVQLHVKEFVLRLIIPLLNYTPGDNEALTGNPGDFVRNRFITQGNTQTTAILADFFLSSLMKKSGSKVNKLCVTHATTTLSAPEATPEMKYGALYMIGIITRDIGATNQEFILPSSYLLPYLTESPDDNPVYLQLVACWVAGNMSQFKFDAKSFTDTVQQLVNIVDKDGGHIQCVKSMAGISITGFLTHKQLYRKLKKQIGKLVLDVLATMEESGNEYEASGTLMTLCQPFIPELEPELGQIFDVIISSILKIIESGDDEKLGKMLVHICPLVDHIGNHNKTWVTPIQQKAVKYIRKVMENKLEDFYSDLFTFMHVINKSSLCPEMLAELELLCSGVATASNADFNNARPMFNDFMRHEPTRFHQDSSKFITMLETIIKRSSGEVLEEAPLLTAFDLLFNLVTMATPKRNEDRLQLMRFSLELITTQFGRNNKVDCAVAKVIFAMMYLDRTLDRTPDLDSTQLHHFVTKLSSHIDLMNILLDASPTYIVGLCTMIRYHCAHLGETQDISKFTPYVKKLVPSIVDGFVLMEQMIAKRGEKEKKKYYLEWHTTRKDLAEYRCFRHLITGLKRMNKDWFDNFWKGLKPRERAKINEIMSLSN